MSENTVNATYSARLPEQIKEKLQTLMSLSDCTTSEFFERLLTTYEKSTATKTTRPEIREIEKNCKNILANMETLVAKIENANIDKQELNNKYSTDLNTLTEEIDTLQAQQATLISEHALAITAHITNIEKLQATIEKLQAENNKMKQTEILFDDLRTEKIELKNELVEAEKKYKLIENNYNSEHEKNIKLTTKIEIIEPKLEKIEKEMKDLVIITERERTLKNVKNVADNIVKTRAKKTENTNENKPKTKEKNE